jgi:hypothetical protein
MSDNFGKNDVGCIVQPCPTTAPTEPTHWVEIELIGEDDQPIPWEEYQLVLPNQEVVKGFLDQQGYARAEGIRPGGACKITFPRLDTEAWSFIETTGAKQQ